MIKFNEITWYSKLLAAIVILGGFPVLAFYIGVEFQKTISIHVSNVPPVQVQVHIPDESKNTDINTQWKTYTNETYGFTFSYPTSNTVEEIATPTYAYSKYRIISAYSEQSFDSVNPGKYPEIKVDVIPLDSEFTYSMSESGKYDRQLRKIFITGDKSEVNDVLAMVYLDETWVGFGRMDASTRYKPGLTDVYIPLEDKDIMLQVSIRDADGIVDDAFLEKFWSEFKVVTN